MLKKNSSMYTKKLQGCCLSHFVAQGTLGYLLRCLLTMAMSLHPGGLYLEPLWVLEMGLPSSIMSSVSTLVSSGFASVTCELTRSMFWVATFMCWLSPYLTLYCLSVNYSITTPCVLCGFTVFLKKSTLSPSLYFLLTHSAILFFSTSSNLSVYTCLVYG